MIARMAVEFAVMAYVMTKHGIRVPIIGSMQRYWSALFTSAPRMGHAAAIAARWRRCRLGETRAVTGAMVTTGHIAKQWTRAGLVELDDPGCKRHGWHDRCDC